MLQLRASSIQETHVIAAAVAELARAGDTLVLSGEMGAGKTAFAQGFGKALGVEEPITSPTFTLVHSYDLPAPVRGARTLHHADLYRLDRTAEVADLALAELAEFGGIVLVEWGDVVESVFGDHLVVHLDSDVLDLADDDVNVAENSSGDETATADVDPSDDGGDERRLIELVGVGASWAARWDRLTRGLDGFRC
jgi:tRNA threonylcarbamoyladenosine biosynthesis protein TsaE